MKLITFLLTRGQLRTLSTALNTATRVALSVRKKLGLAPVVLCQNCGYMHESKSGSCIECGGSVYEMEL